MGNIESLKLGLYLDFARLGYINNNCNEFLKV